MEEFITAKEWAKAIKAPYSTVANWLQKGLIPGASKARVGAIVFWRIPAASNRPQLRLGRPGKGKAG